ncbi:MAG: cyclic nucleotide-binding domain-containing protein [Nitrospinae bacterium]|nr:cyclic nucleotide-binding domain-containing protein [Nitrospinota bacterium]
MEAAELEKYILLLKSVDFFKPFTNEELAELLKYAEVKRYAIQEYIMKEETVEYTFYVLLKGKVNVIKDDPLKRRKVKIAQLGTGACMGEMAMLLDGRRNASIVAATESYVFKVHAKEVEYMALETQLKFIKRVAVNMALKLKDQSATLIEAL